MDLNSCSTGLCSTLFPTSIWNFETRPYKRITWEGSVYPARKTLFRVVYRYLVHSLFLQQDNYIKKVR
jgi:hypothetical protein